LFVAVSLGSILTWSAKTNIFDIFYFFISVKERKLLRLTKRCEVYGVNCITECTCQNWFKKFHSGDFSLKDDQRSGRSTEVDDQIKAIIEEDRHITVREIAERLNVSHTTIENHLKCLGLLKSSILRVSHELKEILITTNINIRDMHLKRNEFDLFLKRIITDDEKWIIYRNIIRRSWSKRDVSAQTTSKAELRQKKIMLSI